MYDSTHRLKNNKKWKLCCEIQWKKKEKKKQKLKIIIVNGESF